MSWIDSINQFGVENAGAFNILSGVGGAASVVSFFKTLDFQDEVLRSLQEIKQNVREIKRNTEIIIQQNKRILEAIDQLPTRYEQRIMFQEEINEGFLKQAYSNLEGTENDEIEFWDINSANWVQYRNSLQFIFNHDNKISNTAKILAHCSFAVQISKGQANGFVKNVIRQRKDNLVILRDKLAQQVKGKLIHLRETLLADTTYVASHNFDDNLKDLTGINYELQPNKYNWVEGPCLVPYTGGRIGCAEPGPPKRVLDYDFKNNRDAHKNTIDTEITNTDNLNNEFGEIASLVLVLEEILNELN